MQSFLKWLNLGVEKTVSSKMVVVHKPWIRAIYPTIFHEPVIYIVISNRCKCVTNGPYHYPFCNTKEYIKCSFLLRSFKNKSRKVYYPFRAFHPLHILSITPHSWWPPSFLYKLQFSLKFLSQVHEVARIYTTMLPMLLE